MDGFGALFGQLIKSPVGNMRKNDEDDVQRMKGIFSNLGYYKRPVENGIIDQELDTAIHTFQKDKDLKVDGYMNPGGETEGALIRTIMSKAADNKKENESKPLPSPLPEKSKAPPDKTEENKESSESKNRCSNEKQRYALSIKNLEQKRGEIHSMQNSIKTMRSEIEKIDEILYKEKKQKQQAKTMGAAVGVGVLGASGAILSGIPGAVAGASVGLSGGGSIGVMAEDIADSVTHTTDMELQKEKTKLQENIKDAEERIERNLIPALNEANDIMIEARQSFERCMKRSS